MYFYSYVLQLQVGRTVVTGLLGIACLDWLLLKDPAYPYSSYLRPWTATCSPPRFATHPAAKRLLSTFTTSPTSSFPLAI